MENFVGNWTIASKKQLLSFSSFMIFLSSLPKEEILDQSKLKVFAVHKYD